MKIFLMRHGEAESYAPSDAERNLTESGRRKVKQQVMQLKNELQSIDCILHSPYLRAKQTAEIAADVLSIKDIQPVQCWTPDSLPLEALNSLENYTNKELLVVTHMPLVGYVEALLCEGDSRHSRGYQCAEITAITADWPAAGFGGGLRQYP